ncbi:MAG TPA: hypothetical protein VFK31_05190 [Rhodanobacteraceae bacterium]|nr:hypothetical protein [Rhodanobacteraceae bacterium]
MAHPAMSPAARTRHGHLWQWLVLPWRAQDQGGQWFMLTILALTLGGAVLLKPFVGSGWPFISGPLTGIAVLVVWFYLMPSCLRLTLSARDLRLPGATAQVYISFALYAVLSSVLPATLFALAGGAGLTVGIAFFLTAAGAFLMALLPGYVGFAVCMAPAMINNLPITYPAWLPQPGDANFLPVLALVGVVLACLGITRWVRISANGIPHSRWRRPLICSLSVAYFGNDRSMPGLHTDEARRIRQCPNWLQPEVDIRATGSGHPWHSLRVALGISWLPLTRRSYWRQTLYGALLLAFSLAFFVLVTHDDTHAQHTLLAVAGWVMLAIGYLASLSPLLGLHRRWSRTNAELPLLALLPHLDAPSRIKTTMLQVCLRLPVTRWLVWTALAWIVACWHHGSITLGITLTMLGLTLFGMLLIAALLLGIVGHQHITRLSMVVLTVYLFVLSLFSGGYALAVLFGRMDFSLPGALMLAFWWVLLLLPLGGFIVNGWRGWQGLPHPFLAREG